MPLRRLSAVLPNRWLLEEEPPRTAFSFDLRLARIEARLGEPMSQADRIIMAVIEKRQRDYWRRRCDFLRRQRRRTISF